MKKQDLTRVRDYIASVEWQFAKTMPQWPHSYTVLQWNEEKSAEFYYFAYLIHKHGSIDPWGKNRWHYLQIDTYKYWVIDNILNRAVPKPNADVLKEGEMFLRKRRKQG